MKVIFLDIDGVLNSSRHFEELRALYESGERRRDEWELEGLSPGYFVPDAVAALNWLVGESRASLVVSSSWRVVGLPRLRARFRVEGVKAPVAGRTADNFDFALATDGRESRITRGQQIEAWLSKSAPPVTSFVILDDEDEMDPHAPRLVRTSSHLGLTMVEARRAASLLNTATGP